MRRGQSVSLPALALAVLPFLALAAAAAQRASDPPAVAPSLRAQLRRDLRRDAYFREWADTVAAGAEVHARPDLDGDGTPEVVLTADWSEGPGNSPFWVYRRTAAGGWRMLHHHFGYQLEAREERTNGWRLLAGATHLTSTSYEDTYVFDGRQYAWVGMDRLDWDTSIDTLRATIRLRSPLPARPGESRTLTLDSIPIDAFPGLFAAADYAACPAARGRRGVLCGRPRLLLSWKGAGAPPWMEGGAPGCIYLQVPATWGTPAQRSAPFCAEAGGDGTAAVFRPTARQWGMMLHSGTVQFGIGGRIVPVGGYIAGGGLFYFVQKIWVMNGMKDSEDRF